MEYYTISPRVRVGPGDPVRIEGFGRKLFRLVAVYDSADRAPYADVVGPIGGIEIYRTVLASRLRSAGRTPRSDVVSQPAVLALSRSAHSARR